MAKKQIEPVEEEEVADPKAAPEEEAQEAAPEGEAKPAAPKAESQVGQVVERLLVAAGKLLYSDPKATSSIVEMVAQGGSPEDGLAQAAMLIIGRLREQAKGMNPNITFAVAPMIVAMIAELAQAAKVVEASPQLMSAALEKVKAQIGGGAQQKPAASQEQPQEEAAPQAPGLIGQQMGA